MAFRAGEHTEYDEFAFDTPVKILGESHIREIYFSIVDIFFF